MIRRKYGRGHSSEHIHTAVKVCKGFIGQKKESQEKENESEQCCGRHTPLVFTVCHHFRKTLTDPE